MHDHAGLLDDDHDHEDPPGGDMNMPTPSPSHEPAASPSPDTQSSGAVTYTANIAPLLKASCTSCHYPGTDEGPNLSTYQQAKALGASILTAVVKKAGQPGFMPQGGKALSAEQIKLLQDWKAGGYALGSSGAGTNSGTDCR
jgi:hypothetical protein